MTNSQAGDWLSEQFSFAAGEQLAEGWLSWPMAADLGSASTQIMARLPEDTYGKQHVDADPLVLWNFGEFRSSTGWTPGDFDAEWFADGKDFAIWKLWKYTEYDSTRNYFVPEPGTWGLLLAGVAYFSRWSEWRRRASPDRCALRRGRNRRTCVR